MPTNRWRETMHVLMLVVMLVVSVCCLGPSSPGVKGGKPRLAVLLGLCDSGMLEDTADGSLLNTLSSDGRVTVVQVSESDVNTIEKMGAYDAIFLGSSISAQTDLSSATTNLLNQYVNAGGGLITSASIQTAIYAGRADLADVLPVNFDDHILFCNIDGLGSNARTKYPMTLYKAGVSHEIVNGLNYISASSPTSLYMGSGGLATGSTSLAYVQGDTDPSCEYLDAAAGSMTPAIGAQAVAVKNVGQGRSAYFGFPICSLSFYVGNVQNLLVNPLFGGMLKNAVWWAVNPCPTQYCNATHGTCSAINTCTCEYGWNGSPDCSTFSCSPVCDAAHGTCTGVDVCTCAAHYDPDKQCTTCLPNFEGTNCASAVATDEIQDPSFEDAISKWTLTNAEIKSDGGYDLTNYLTNSASGTSIARQAMRLYFPTPLSGVLLFSFYAKGTGTVKADLSQNQISLDSSTITVTAAYVKYQVRLNTNLTGTFNFSLIMQTTGTNKISIDLIAKEYQYCSQSCKNGGYCISADMCHCQTGYATPFCTNPICGDGKIISPEECDDGDTTDGNGCSASCTIEPGFTCTGTPSNCTNVCGDRIASWPYEQCDDGNNNPNDGCSPTCKVEAGYKCLSKNTTCTPICGDNLIIGGEPCDNGNQPGCTNCQIDQGYACSGNPSVCVHSCGDGLLFPSEDCDTHGNTPGCNSCKVTPGWKCTNPDGWTKSSVCSPICGDGILIAGQEECDDGNTYAGDGCSSFCQIETYYTCPTPNAPCQTSQLISLVVKNITITPPQCSGASISKSTGGTVVVDIEHSPAGGTLLFTLKGINTTTSSVGLFTSIYPGNYNLTVSKSFSWGTPNVTTKSITVPAASAKIAASAVAETTVGCSSADGKVTITITSGTPAQTKGATYYLSGKAQASNVFSDLAAAYYTPSVVDANGCYITLAKIAVKYPSGCSDQWFNLWSRGGPTGTIVLAVVISFIILCFVIFCQWKKHKVNGMKKNYIHSIAGVPDEDLMPRRRDDSSKVFSTL